MDAVLRLRPADRVTRGHDDWASAGRDRAARSSMRDSQYAAGGSRAFTTRFSDGAIPVRRQDVDLNGERIRIHSNGQHTCYSITRTDEFAGFCQQDPPARARPIERVIDGMQRQLDKQRVHYDVGDRETWELTIDLLQKRLRSTWERAVDEAVGPVIRRLSNKVETKGLAKLTTLTMEDCTKMRLAYERYSTLLHSSADTLNSPVPGAVQREITELR